MMNEEELEFKRGQYEALKTAYRFFGQGDLMKFWLFENHRCMDKWVHYFPIYEKWFSPYRGKDIVFVEIGVQNGGSIQMWKNYFGKDAKIIGVDIDKRCKQFEDENENIFIEIGSQDDEKFWGIFKNKYPRVDILIDDGGHTMNQQITTFKQMFPHIEDDGLYMCEACGTSYDKNFGGGFYSLNTFIKFMKKLIDEINFYDSEKGTRSPTYYSYNVGGLHFYNNMVILEKKASLHNPFDLRIGDITTFKFDDAL